MQKTPVAIYVHIPFCKQKCLYCDFLSFCSDKEEHRSYVNNLLREIDYYKTDSIVVDSVFFGGGTPTVIETGLIEKILCKLRDSFVFNDEVEITIEANPGTVSYESLAAYKQMGINRISFGLQSADDDELKRLGRIHDFKMFEESFSMARKAGYDNINIDLIMAIPGQSINSYEHTLDKVIALAPEHISAYSLIIEEGTPFYEMYGDMTDGQVDTKRAEQGIYLLPTEDEERSMYALNRDKLKDAGYLQYEISNFSKPNYESRHNIAYWTLKEYIGLGLGASSLYQGERYNNETDFAEYAGHFVCEESRVKVSEKDAMEEMMFLGLRMNRGVSKKAFFDRFNKPVDEVFPGVIEKHVKNGLMEVCGDFVRLTEKGMDVSNYCMSDFIIG